MLFPFLPHLLSGQGDPEDAALSQQERADRRDAGKNDGKGRNYIRLYREANGLPARENGQNPKRQKLVKIESTPGYEEFDYMTREELIGEIIKARINEARAKKGYLVKGDGAEKVFEPIGNRNTK